MRKLIAAINLTIDGFCDHTAGVADEDLHQHYTELLRNADTILFGRITYQLMEIGWPPVVANPTGIKAMDEFAVVIDNISKIVFSNTMQTATWKNTILTREDIKEVVLKLKHQAGKNILAGSRTIITTLMQLNLVDEYQFCIHPVVLGSGLPLFEKVRTRIDLELVKTRTFDSGAVMLYYLPS